MKWEDFDRFDNVTEKYLPGYGEGDTLATQIVTATCKLVYKWFNDGDVYDNRYYLSGWANDLSSYANWLDKHTGAGHILSRITGCTSDEQYETLLYNLCEFLLNEKILEEQNKIKAIDSIYDCNGDFVFEEYDEEEDEEYYG